MKPRFDLLFPDGWRDASIRQGLLLFIALHLFLTVWAMVVLSVSPLPEEPNETERPYLGQPILADGVEGWLLGPWQRFDALHYTRIAAQGYADEADSVFPPLYPLLIRLASAPFGNNHVAHLTAALLIGHVAMLALFILLHKYVSLTYGAAAATRTVVYLALFPTAFYLFAPYTEPLFLLFTLISIGSAQNGRFYAAGLAGALAALTRLTGWVLVVPLAYAFWRRCLGYGKWKIEPASLSWHVALQATAVTLPALATAAFIGYRWLIGLPGLSHIYAEYWFQRTGFPGADIPRALQTLFLGGYGRAGEFTLWFDLACTLLLIGTTVWAFRRLGWIWSLYAAMLLFFILLPTSALKPLYSFSRYTLAFFPTFILLGLAGENPWINRLILYTSIVFFLYFSGQFFIWGWVA